MDHIIFASTVYTGSSILYNQLIQIKNGRITSINPGNKTDGIISVHSISSGFTDIHINGGSHLHFTKNPEVESLRDIDNSCSALGTAYSLPSLITSPLENIIKGIEAIKNYQQQNPNGGIFGMHLEGPFINPLKRGAHLLKYIRLPTDGELKEIIRHGRDIIKVMTIAPELFNHKQLELLLDSGITISAGHSNANFSDASMAFTQGVHMVTHLYNAMSPFSHRSPGLVGAAFEADQVYTPIIPDGFHVDFAAVRTAYRLKKDKLILISDALFTGRKLHHFQWEEFNASLINNQYINSEGNLAGSAISIGEAVHNAVYKIGIPIDQAIEMVTIRPAKALGMDRSLGKIATGYPARFTVFDDSLKIFKVLNYLD